MASYQDIERWAHSKDVAERRRALREAESSHDLRVVELVARMARTDTDEAVKIMAQTASRVLRTRLERALSRLDAGAAAAPTPPPIAVGLHSRKKLTSLEPRERRDAVIEIMRLGERHRVEELLATLAKEKEGWVRAEIAEALGILARPEVARDALVGMLTDAVSRVRANAVEALGKLRPAGFAEPVKKLLMDPDRRVRTNAIVAIGIAEHLEGRDALDALLESGDPLDGKAGVFALGQLGSPEAEERLRFLADNADNEVAQAARKALEYFGGRET